MTNEYKIYLTPLENLTTYSSQVEITKYLKFGGLQNISSQIDRGDFEVGFFIYNSVTITLLNESGVFNDPNLDGRSLFPFTRENAIIEVAFVDKNDVETTSFKGLIDERATSQNLNQCEISFTILDFSSLMSRVSIDPGSILSGYTISQVINIFLNRPEITKLLNYSDLNINPSIDSTITDGSVFDSVVLKTAMDDVLAASNSILLIDSSDNIIVRSRTENSNTPNELFLNDQFKRDNILSIESYNTGRQRLFNSIVINETRVVDEVSKNAYRATNQQEFTFDFIDNITTETAIAQSIVDEFSFPKIEIELTINRDEFTAINFLDKYTLDINYHLIPYNQKFPLYGYSKYGLEKYPVEASEFRILPTKIFKLIGITEIIGTYTYRLKLREI